VLEAILTTAVLLSLRGRAFQRISWSMRRVVAGDMNY
jgi:hypothetical protein